MCPELEGFIRVCLGASTASGNHKWETSALMAQQQQGNQGLTQLREEGLGDLSRPAIQIRPIWYRCRKSGPGDRS